MAFTELPPQVDHASRPSADHSSRPSKDALSLYSLAAVLIVTSTSWFLLKELGPLLRPLVLAVFLAYLVVPIHRWLRCHIGATTSAVVILGGTPILIWGLAMVVYGGIVELNADLPRLIDRARGLVASARAYGHANLPRGLVDASPTIGESEVQGWNMVLASMRILVSSGVAMLTEAFVVGVYLIFLLLDLRRFPRRIRKGFESERAEAILGVIARINAATAHYLRAKAVASLSAGISSAIILWVFGVRHPVMWGALIFFGNFIPYVGSLVAVSFPVLLAFLDLDPFWKPCVVTLALVLIQVVVGYVIEPILMGKAVDLSPLVTLLCLAFWSLCWGLTGMLLAVPLTATLKIIWENVPYTRPLAALIAEGDG